MATQHEHVIPAPAADPSFTPPSLARRFAALLLDWILCLLVANLYGDPFRDGWSPILALILEYGLFIGFFAQTPGMRLARIACVAFADGGRIGVIRALLRGTLLCLVVPTLIMDDRRRGLHDRAAGSIVVHMPSPPARPTAPPAR